jgi:hypothetical protein
LHAQIQLTVAAELPLCYGRGSFNPKFIQRDTGRYLSKACLPHKLGGGIGRYADHVLKGAIIEGIGFAWPERRHKNQDGSK